ncbi:MAG: BrnT family toxin [Terriglobales bacterium]
MSSSLPEFEWDPDKARTNQRKHGVSFEEAATVFFDEAAAVEDDPGHSRHGENRSRMIGRADTGRVLVVAYCETGDVIRIISARKASRSEERNYEKGE